MVNEKFLALDIWMTRIENHQFGKVSHLTNKLEHTQDSITYFKININLDIFQTNFPVPCPLHVGSPW